MQDEDTARFHDPKQAYPKVLFRSSHFIDKLCYEGPNGAKVYKYDNVRRWTRKHLKHQLPHYHGLRHLDKMIAPVHLGNHWVCTHASQHRLCNTAHTWLKVTTGAFNADGCGGQLSGPANRIL